MPSVTIIVSAGSGCSTEQSFGWKEKKNNLEVERITVRYGICGRCVPCIPQKQTYAKEIG
jgi:hypothetical protein